MFLKFQKGKQTELIKRAIAKAGSERKLCTRLIVSKASIYRYKFEIVNIPEKIYNKIIIFLNINKKVYEKYIIKRLPDNWGQIKGGINCFTRKKMEGKFDETIEKLKVASSKRMKNWHKIMKKNFPKEYHIWQYERFKKVGRGYKFKLINNIKVRNKLEKKVGNFLIKNKIKFEYEPYLNINGKVYFPDYKIGNIIIEVTEWKHPSHDKIKYLIKKVEDYKKFGYKSLFFIPELYRNFYKSINSSVISNLSELKKKLKPL